MNDYEIYQVDFDYFEKLVGINNESKVRPALVIVSKSLEIPLMFPITTTKRSKHYEIRDWKQAGLSRPSYLVYDFSREVSPKEKLTYVGKLSDYDIQRIKSERLLKEMKEDKNLPDVAEESIIEQEDAGISALFIEAINECWSAIDMYNSMIVTLDSLDRHEFDETLKSLLEDRNKEVGSLQAILELVNNSSKEVEEGRSEVEDSIAFDVVEESMNEADEWPESINEGE